MRSYWEELLNVGDLIQWALDGVVYKKNPSETRFVEAYTHHNKPSDRKISLHGSVSKWGEPSIDPAEPLNSKRYPSFQDSLNPTDYHADSVSISLSICFSI